MKAVSCCPEYLEKTEIDEELESLVFERTEGIPFFIEELIKTLKDMDAIEIIDNKYFLKSEKHRQRIPESIQDIIMSRVDRLGDTAKNVIKTGIGH